MLQMPITTDDLVERVLMMFPQAHRISASMYFGCIFSLIKRWFTIADPGPLTSLIFLLEQKNTGILFFFGALHLK
jgi:hypothetical protein